MSNKHENVTQDEIRPLTGIRGIAAFYVVLFHFFTSWIFLFPQIGCLKEFSSKGHLGVDLFFILSGFILCYVYHAGKGDLKLKNYGKFLWFRFARIYPNHLVTLLVLIALVFVSQHKGVAITDKYPISDLPYQFTMTHAWAVATQWIQPGHWNYPSWSISAEWFAYMFMFPLSWWILSRVKSGFTSLCACLFLLSLWVFVVLPYLEKSQQMHLSQIIQVSMEFICGGFLFRTYQQLKQLGEWCQKYVMFVLALIVIILFLPTKSFHAAPAWATMCFPLFLLGLTAEKSLLTRFLASEFMVWLGKVSYAIYMSHAVAMKILKIVLPWEKYQFSSLAVRSGILVINLAVIMCFAVALYYLVEIPGRNIMRRFYLRVTQK